MISAIVHTYNEETNIERALSSLGFVGEIIVVDMGSTDKTIAIAKKFKAKIFHHPYTGFVEPARNFAISKTTGDWIFIIDADEEVSKSLADTIRSCIKKNEYDYIRVPRMNIIFGKWIKHTGWWPDYQIRLFKKGHVEWVDTIHGIPITHGLGWDIDPTQENSIIHYNYQSMDQFLTRMNRYSTITAKEMFVSNRKFVLGDLFDKPSQEFIRRYFIWEGHKDGLHGLVLSLLQSFSELLTYLKLWELEEFQEHAYSLSQVHKAAGSSWKEKNFWYIQKLLETPLSIPQKFSLKLKRRLKIHE